MVFSFQIKKNHCDLVLGSYTSQQSKLLAKIFQVEIHGMHAAEKQSVRTLTVVAREGTTVTPKAVQHLKA